MKNPKNKTNEICDTCIHHYVIVGCSCCGKPNASWCVDANDNFCCNDYVEKKEVNNEKKDCNA